MSTDKIEEFKTTSGSTEPFMELGSRRPRVFVLDDDPIFCRLLQKTGTERGADVTVCSSLTDLGTDPRHSQFDVAIIDYYIEEMTGTDIACLVQQRPVILVSRSEDWMDSDRVWPDCIQKFVSKKDGVIAILDAALKVIAPSQTIKGIA